MANEFEPPKAFDPSKEADFFMRLVPHVWNGNGDASQAMISELCTLSPDQAKETMRAMNGSGVFVAGTDDPFDRIAGLYSGSSFKKQVSSLEICEHKGK
jgi:hypothetical protein